MGYVFARGLAIRDFYLTDRDRSFLALLDRLRHRGIEPSFKVLEELGKLSGEEVLQRFNTLSDCGIIRVRRINL